MKESSDIAGLLCDYSRKIARRHLVMGPMGNISAYEGGVVWIKRRGAWMEEANPDDFIRVGHGNKGLASKEINLHLGCYKSRVDIKAVVHTHPLMITAIGTILGGLLSRQARRILRLFCFARNDRGIAVIKNYTPGSIALAKAVSRAVKKADSVVMANHGLVTVGDSLKDAYQKVIELEGKAKDVLIRTLIGISR